MTLFDRTKRPMELTEAGKLYVEFCRDVLNRNEEFELALDDLKSDVAARCGWRRSTPWGCRR